MQNTKGAIMKFNKGITMKYLILILATMQIANAQMTTAEIDFQNHFFAAMKELFPSHKSVGHEKYVSFCDPSATITNEQGQVIPATCGFSRVGCSLENCNDYTVDASWYSFKKYSPAVFDVDGNEVTPAESIPEFYETIMMFNKPLRSVVQVKVDSILLVIKEKKDWSNRVLKIKDVRVLLIRCGNNEVNGQSVLIRIHKNKTPADLDLLDCIEAEKINFSNENAAKKAKSDKIKTGKAIRDVCQSAIDLIIGWNVLNNLSEAQINSMQITFSETEKALKDSRPALAKKFALLINPDGVIVTEQMKLEVIEILDTILVQ